MNLVVGGYGLPGGNVAAGGYGIGNLVAPPAAGDGLEEGRLVFVGARENDEPDLRYLRDQEDAILAVLLLA